MYQRPSIPERINELLGLVGEWGKFALAREASALDEKDERRVKLMRRLYKGPSTVSTMMPFYDREFVARKVGEIAALQSECTSALESAVASFQVYGQQLRNHGRSGHVLVDCGVMVETYRAAYDKILVFNIRSAQILCAMEEIRGSVRIIQECASDACVPPLFAPPADAVDDRPQAGVGGDIPPLATKPQPGATVGQPPETWSGDMPTFRRPPFDWPPRRDREDFGWLKLHTEQQDYKLSEIERRTIDAEAAAAANAELLKSMREREGEWQRLDDLLRASTESIQEQFRAFDGRLHKVEQQGSSKTPSGKGS